MLVRLANQPQEPACLYFLSIEILSVLLHRADLSYVGSDDQMQALMFA